MNTIRKHIIKVMIIVVGLLPLMPTMAHADYDDAHDGVVKVVSNTMNLVFKPKEQSMVPGIAGTLAAIWYYNKAKACAEKVKHTAKCIVSSAALAWGLCGVYNWHQGGDVADYLSNSVDKLQDIGSWLLKRWEPIAIGAAVLPVIDTGSCLFNALCGGPAKK